MSEKLQKVLARQGLGSRRELDALIAAGRVEVNGKVAEVGDRVEGPLTVKIDGKVVLTPLSEKPKCRVLMYYKPEGEVTTYKDPEDRPTVFDHLPRPDGGRWIYVGRLDLNTSGLLLFTTDGELANALMHPSKEIERVYAARIYGEVTDEQIAALKQGVMLEDGKASFDKVVFVGGEGRNQWYHVSLKEGRNREVRRLWEAVGLQVSRLIRIRYAGVDLDNKLRAGKYRELTLSEINNLRAAAGLKALESSEIARTSLASMSNDKKHALEKFAKHKAKIKAEGRKALNASHNPFRKGRSDDKDRNPYGSRSGKSVYGDAKRSSYGRKDNGRFAKRFSKNDR